MNMSDVDPAFMATYVGRQLDTFFYDGDREHEILIPAHVSAALERTFVCIASVKMWKEDQFDYLHTSQYLTFLYYLSNEIWREAGNRSVCNKIFFLNKSLNGIDLFYEINMPRRFFVGHSVGIVLAKAVYGENLVLYQNSTVGRHRDRIPNIGDGVVVYPNSAIVGACNVGANTVLPQGTSLIDTDTPGDCVVESGQGMPSFKAIGRRYADDYFRMF